MKRKIAIWLLLITVLQQYILAPVLAAIETGSYSWILGKYNTSTKTFSPEKTSEFYWDGKTVRTIGPWSIYNGADGTRQGSIISFVDKNKPVDNGYPMVCMDDWDKWITYFNGNPTYVKSVLNKWTILTGDKITYKTFANFSQLVELCGGKGISYSRENMLSNYVRSYPPTLSLTASSTAVKVGQPFKLFVKAQSSTYYYQFIDVKLTGAGNTYIDKRYMSNNVYEEKNLYFSSPGQYRFTLQINDGVYRYASREILINVAEDPVIPEQPPAPPPPEPPVGEPNSPPVARFSWPAISYEGQQIHVTENSVDYDGQIVNWEWDFSDRTKLDYELGQGGGTVTFDEEGDKELTLAVTDDKGAYDSITKTTKVLAPIPTARITYSGTLKENRKVILSSYSSRTPSGMIDHSKDFWIVTPVSGGTAEDIKLGVKSGSEQEVLFKKAGTYKVGLRVSNERYDSEWVYKDIVIGPDLNPVADFIVSSIVLRDPADGNFATINISDKSYSPDDDTITERVWKYRFDSNNDGSFSDETWVTLDTGNNTKPVLKTNQVGKYLIDLDVKETFGQPTIPTFVSYADRRAGNTAFKALSQKVVDVQNIAPETYFVARPRPKADIVFAVGNNADMSKIDNLNNYIETYIKPKMAANNIDAQITIDNTENLGPNLLQDPGFESSSSTWLAFNSVTNPWTSGKWGWVRSKEAVRTTVKRSGASSYYLDAHWSGQGGFDPRYTNYQGQSIIGSNWVGKTIKYGGWINGSLFHADPYLRLRADNSYIGSNSAMIADSYSYFPVDSYPLNTWVYTEGSFTVPPGTQDIKLFIGELGLNSDITTYLDDLFVKVISRRMADEALDNITWRDGSSRYLISISDEQLVNSANVAAFKSELVSQNIAYSVIGSAANQAEAQNIITATGGKGKFYNNSNFDAAFNQLGQDIANGVTPDTSAIVQYLLLEESFLPEPHYSDYENDPKYADNWYYVHTPSFVDNDNGLSLYNGKTCLTPLSNFDKYGKYDVYYKAQDDPTAGNNVFANYRLWSNPSPTTIIVHRKPVASFTVQPGTLYITDTSYDPDFQYKRPDKGLVEWYWKWKKTADTNWTVGKPSGIVQPDDYNLYLKVKDCYGIWSDPFQQTITVTELNRPPNADFTWTPSSVFESDNVTLINLSSDPDNNPLTYQWTVFHPNGVTKTYSTKNISLTNVLSGPYWLTLRVWDSHNASDAATKSFIVNPLGITGQVMHTDQWDTKRITYNRSVSGRDDYPRSYNVFWAGEKFILSANTTDTTPSDVEAQTVTVTMPSVGTTATLTGNADKIHWTGAVWQENFINLPDGPYKFVFTVTYSNGAVKTNEVWVNISGSIYDYNRFHRAE